MKSLETPYGKTSFTYGESGGSIRWVEATDPYGDTERVQLVLYNSTAINPAAPSNEVPNISGVSFNNNFLQHRNNLLLEQESMDGEPWRLLEGENLSLDSFKLEYYVGIVESIKQPYASRIWYRYPGNDSVIIDGDSNPTAIAQNVETPSGGVASMAERFEYQDVVAGGVHSNPLVS